MGHIVIYSHRHFHSIYSSAQVANQYPSINPFTFTIVIMTMQSNTLHEIPTASAPLPMHRNDSNLASSRSPPVPRLFDLCKHVLRTNVAHIVDVGDIPYEMISDILYGCRVNQLRDIEDSSPHIAEEDEGEVFI